MLRRILYSSVRPPGLTDAEVIRTIAVPSRERNLIDGVTSCLWFGPGCFVQVLEGEEGVLDALMERITSDPRHGNIHILSRSTAALRLFDGWPLKLVGAAQCPAAADLAAALRTAEGDGKKTEGGDMSAGFVVTHGPTISLALRLACDDGQPAPPTPPAPPAAQRFGRAQKTIDMLGELVMATPLIYP
jgi:hypothetical protein